MASGAQYALLARTLIAKHGREVTFRRINDVVADPSRPWIGTPSPVVDSLPIIAVFVPFRGFEFGSMYENDQLLKDVEQVCLVGGGQGDLETYHYIVEKDGREYKIEWVRRLKPGDDTVMYAFGVDL